MAEQIAYLPCPIIGKELKEEILSLGYIAVDDDFAPDGYVLPPELQSIKQRIDDENAAIVAQAKQFNDALDALADSKRPASKQWVKDYIAEHGGGGGGGSNQQTFIAQYQSTTAQDIVAFLENNPHAAVLVQNGDDIYSTIFSKIIAENKVILRVIASLQSKFNIFEYTVTNGSWVATTTPLYYDDTAIKQRLDTAEEWIDTLKLFTYKVIIDNIEVPAAVNGVGGRVNVQGNIIDLPEGYEVKALRSYSVERVTGAVSGDLSWKQGSFNMIGTAGGGRKGNLGILNNSSEIVKVKVNLEYNCGKVYPQAGA